MDDKNIKIPFSLLAQMVNLLEHWNVQEYDYSIQQDYDEVLFSLLKKKQKLELRQAYAKILFADNEDQRHDARMEYLSKKRTVEEPF